MDTKIAQEIVDWLCALNSANDAYQLARSDGERKVATTGIKTCLQWFEDHHIKVSMTDDPSQVRYVVVE